MATRQVRTRRVFYIPGYDPIHPRRYRELYRKEGAAQAVLRGYDIALKPRKGARYGWSVDARIEGAETRAEVEVLVWSDIVRESMGAGIVQTYTQMLQTASTYIGTGALARLFRLRKGPVIAALYPVAALLLQLLAAIVVGWLASGLSATALAMIGTPPLLSGLAAGIVFCVVALISLRWFKRHDGKFFAYYLMHDYAFSARWGGANPEALEVRMSEFGQAIASALAEDVDEVLVVGHSSGAHLGVSVLADLIRAGKVPANGPRLSFLSLGQVVPMMSFLPKAHRLRSDLRLLGGTTALDWVDVTAPGDGCAFALCDPVAVTGVAGPDRTGPLVLSAAFTQTLRPETWNALRWRFFRVHFQYLCAFDNLPDASDAYDYFAVTAGPQTLGERFETRRPSGSLIDRPLSRYTSTAA
ncbi:hypothetical protein [Palleronia abyssalis]|uniref:Uncharacterized protein n=1 Tax=Palleronia abyssalis TaxID=1501240 RepID=A0A2R8BU88_9RHOB|nr:hypothetical protein [Palleronia abyssalis]SPJ23695.1 hypothetical protein PAA8504_01510 [Palleronia abyssalis]